MPDAERISLAKYRIEKAEECLKVAVNLLTLEDYLAVLNESQGRNVYSITKCQRIFQYS